MTMTASMAPDSRPAHLDRATQIAMVAAALEAAKSPLPSLEVDEDGEMRLSIEERIESAVFACTHNDVVARAVAAAKRAAGWGAHLVLAAAEEREALNARRAANAKKFGRR